MRLPVRALAALAGHPRVERIHLVVSRGAAQVLRHELGRHSTGADDLVEAADLDREARAKVVSHPDSDLGAAIASGSYPLDGTVVLPLSAGTLAALAIGSASTLVHRAGAVALKERWPLILGFRETPLTVIHLENLRRLAWLGAVVMPPVPAFYIGGEEMDRFLDHYALRILDRFGLGGDGDDGGLRWG